jgi:hypothetical protein
MKTKLPVLYEHLKGKAHVRISNTKVRAQQRNLKVFSPLLSVETNLVKRFGSKFSLPKHKQQEDSFTTTRFHTIKEADGTRRSVELPKRVRAWWWITENGKLALNVRYGARAIEISKGKTAVEIANANDLVPTLSC